MKKYIFGVIVSLALLVSPIAVQQAEATTLTPAQISAIVTLLQSFGVEPSVINNVQATLSGGASTTGGNTTTNGSTATTNTNNTSGVVNVSIPVTLNGRPWTPSGQDTPVVVRYTRPATCSDCGVLTRTVNAPIGFNGPANSTGTYTVEYVSGGPTGATFHSMNDVVASRGYANALTSNTGGTLVFSINFVRADIHIRARMMNADNSLTTVDPFPFKIKYKFNGGAYQSEVTNSMKDYLGAAPGAYTLKYDRTTNTLPAGFEYYGAINGIPDNESTNEALLTMRLSSNIDPTYRTFHGETNDATFTFYFRRTAEATNTTTTNTTTGTTQTTSNNFVRYNGTVTDGAGGTIYDRPLYNGAPITTYDDFRTPWLACENFGYSPAPVNGNEWTRQHAGWILEVPTSGHVAQRHNTSWSIVNYVGRGRGGGIEGRDIIRKLVCYRADPTTTTNTTTTGTTNTTTTTTGTGTATTGTTQTTTTGTVSTATNTHLRYTINGVTVNTPMQVVANYTRVVGTAPADTTTVTIGFPADVSLPAGSHGLHYISGGPAGATLSNIDGVGANSTGQIRTTQTLASNGEITFTFNFITSAPTGTTNTTGTGTGVNTSSTATTNTTSTSGVVNVSIPVTLNGHPWTPSGQDTPVVVRYTRPATCSDCGVLTRTVNAPIGFNGPANSTGTYEVEYVSGGPAGATFHSMNDVVASRGYANALTSSTGGTLVFSINFVRTGTIHIRTSWNGVQTASTDATPFVINYIAPNSNSQITTNTNANYPGAPSGIYSVSYVSGPLPASSLRSITPAPTQTLAPNGEITFTFNFAE